MLLGAIVPMHLERGSLNFFWRWLCAGAEALRLL